MDFLDYEFLYLKNKFKGINIKRKRNRRKKFVNNKKIIVFLKKEYKYYIKYL